MTVDTSLTTELLGSVSGPSIEGAEYVTVPAADAGYQVEAHPPTPRE